MQCFLYPSTWMWEPTEGIGVLTKADAVVLMFRALRTRSPWAADNQARCPWLRTVRAEWSCANGDKLCDSTEVESLIETAKANRYGQRDAIMILVGYRHGLRAAEL